MIRGREREPLRVVIRFVNDNPNTVWNRLAARLGREPTHAEAVAEVKRILGEGGRKQAGR